MADLGHGLLLANLGNGLRMADLDEIADDLTDDQLKDWQPDPIPYLPIPMDSPLRRIRLPDEGPLPIWI